MSADESYSMGLKCRASRDYVNMRHYFSLSASQGHPGACREWYQLSWDSFVERRVFLLRGCGGGNTHGAVACTVQLWLDYSFSFFDSEDDAIRVYVETRMRELCSALNVHAIAMQEALAGRGIGSLWDVARPMLEKRVVAAEQVWMVFDAVEQRDFGEGMRALASLSNNSYVMWWLGKWLWTYWNERRGLQRDPKEALLWLLESARQGDADGANDLIELLFDSSSGVSDWVAGAHWLMTSWTRKDLLPARLQLDSVSGRVEERLRELYVYGCAFQSIALNGTWCAEKDVVITSAMMETAKRVYVQTRRAVERTMLVWLCSQRFDAHSLVSMLPREVAVLIWREYVHPVRAMPDMWQVNL